MTDTTSPTPATAPTLGSAVAAALASASATAVSSLEANAVAYIQTLESKAKTELGVVESKLAALWTKVKAYAPAVGILAVVSGVVYAAVHFLHI